MNKNEVVTLKDSQEYNREHWEKGCKCLSCGQLVKLYKRKLNSGMAFGLIAAYKMSQEKNGQYYHINELLKKGIASSQLEIPRLQYWGLMANMPNEDDPTKSHSGFWRITDKGKEFVERKIKVQKHILIYNSVIVGFSDEETTIDEALGNKFNYEELMNG